MEPHTVCRLSLFDGRTVDTWRCLYRRRSLKVLFMFLACAAREEEAWDVSVCR